MAFKNSAGAIKNAFSLDLRSIAILRISMGLLIFYDLAYRCLSFTEHYTNRGAIPHELFSRTNLISLHNLSDTAFIQATLFGLQMILAIALALGFKTRIVSVLSWILLVSLQNRSQMMWYPGDPILVIVLFWGCFLPWHMRFSIDSFNERRDENFQTAFGLGTVGYLIQILMIYFMAGLSKNGASWSEGTAVAYALSLKAFDSGRQEFLLRFPQLLTFLSQFTRVVELAVPPLLLIPFFKGFIRMTAVFSLIFLMISLNIFLDMNNLAYVSGGATLGLLPSSFWDILTPKRLSLFTKKSPTKSAGCFEYSFKHLPLSKAAALIGLILVSLNNVNNILFYGYFGKDARFLLRDLDSISIPLRLNQPWMLFHEPRTHPDGWVVVPGYLRSGKQVDFVTGSALSWDVPELVPKIYGNFRRRRYFSQIGFPDNSLERIMKRPGDDFRKSYLAYICRAWNANSVENDPLEKLEFVYMKAVSALRPALPPAPEKIILNTMSCKEMTQIGN